jgi:hypothetical protein
MTIPDAVQNTIASEYQKDVCGHAQELLTIPRMAVSQNHFFSLWRDFHPRKTLDQQKPQKAFGLMNLICSRKRQRTLHCVVNTSALIDSWMLRNHEVMVTYLNF